MAETSTRYSSLPTQEAPQEDDPLLQVKLCTLFPEFRDDALEELNFSVEDKEAIRDLLRVFDDLRERHAKHWDPKVRRFLLWQPAAHKDVIEDHESGDWIAFGAEYKRSVVAMKKVLAEEGGDRAEQFKKIMPLFDAPLKVLRDAKDKGLKDHMQLTKQRTNIIARAVTFGGVAVGILMWMKRLFFPQLGPTMGIGFTVNGQNGEF